MPRDLLRGLAERGGGCRRDLCAGTDHLDGSNERRLIRSLRTCIAANLIHVGGDARETLRERLCLLMLLLCALGRPHHRNGIELDCLAVFDARMPDGIREPRDLGRTRLCPCNELAQVTHKAVERVDDLSDLIIAVGTELLCEISLFARHLVERRGERSKRAQNLRADEMGCADNDKESEDKDEPLDHLGAGNACTARLIVGAHERIDLGDIVRHLC